VKLTIKVMLGGKKKPPASFLQH